MGYWLIPREGQTADRQPQDTDLPSSGQGSPVYLQRGTLYPERDFHAPGPQGNGLPQEGGHYLVQFENPPSEEERLSLEMSGITVVRYLPENTYVVSIKKGTPSFFQAATNLAGGIRRWESPAPIQKISPAIDQDAFPPNARYAGGRVGVLVLFFDDVLDEEATELLTALNPAIEIIRREVEKIFLVKTPRGLITQIATLDAVEWVEPAPGPNNSVNATAAERINVDVIRTAPLSVLGTGVSVGIWDGGSVYAHDDFDDRLTVVDTAATVHWHSTHVAGTVGGSGLGNLNALGMAPEVLLYSFDWDFDADEMELWATNGIDISNHSYSTVTGWYYDGSVWINYGASDFGRYTSLTRRWDEVVYDTDLLVFKSAGNDRADCCSGNDCPVEGSCDGPYDSIPPRGVAKNVLTIGATTDTDGMTSFSSWGPTNDGRIKPDLCANGTSLLSTYLNDQYVSVSGTSMASPSAAGAAALLFEHFEHVNGSPPSAAALKALLIHGAQDLGATGPDYRFGWGLIDAKASAEFISRNAWQHGTIDATGQINETHFEVPEGMQTLKATLVWTDPAASVWVTLSLVNDLDLVLRDPNGDEHDPWILDKDNPSSVATKDPNHVDNVEQVVVDTPISGTWTAEVRGYSVPLDPQNYIVIVKELGDPCGVDLDGDGDIDGSDIQLLAADYGSSQCPCEGDVDCDLSVDAGDLILFSDDFGTVISSQ